MLMSAVKFVVLPLISLGMGLIAYSRISTRSVDAIQYKTAPIEVRTLRQTISATGTLEPKEIVDVGAQVSGRIVQFGTDPNTGDSVDYCSRVTKGMLLAKIDPAVYEVEVQIARAQAKRSEALVVQAEAQLAEAQAQLRRNVSELVQQKARLQRVKKDWERISKLAKVKASSDAELDAAQSDLDSASAGIEVSEATISQSKSRVELQKASLLAAQAEFENATAVLQRAETTLSYCSIVSPIDGTIIDRRVNQGQTVASSLSTPSLFLIASDLRDLEIWVSVNEADIGLIEPGLPVQFTVDSLPTEQFCGSVKQVRLNASMSQNVVTYTVVVSAENPGELLIPYLTANVEFVIDERASALCVPNAALLFSPSSNESQPANEDKQTVWIVDSDSADMQGIREINVKVGTRVGSYTEIQSPELRKGWQVIVGEAEEESKRQMSNPFVPKLGRGEKK